MVDYVCTFRLEFGTAPSAEAGAPPVITNDILSMVSPEGESVPLLKVSVHLMVVCIVYVHVCTYPFSLCSKLKLVEMLRTG